jgi:hypothetical protein
MITASGPRTSRTLRSASLTVRAEKTFAFIVHLTSFNQLLPIVATTVI